MQNLYGKCAKAHRTVQEQLVADRCNTALLFSSCRGEFPSLCQVLHSHTELSLQYRPRGHLTAYELW